MSNDVNWIIDCIPAYDGGDDGGIFDCNNGCFMFRIINTTKAGYDNYLIALDKAGLMLYDTHEIRDNYFATFVHKDFLVQVYFTSHDGITRIIVDPNTNLYKREGDLPYKEVCDTTLYQMELDYRTIDCGMCYIVQCVDGSFFIIDSAHMNSTDDHIRLYKILRRLTPKGQKTVISGWFFSHAHQDHIVKFMDFVEADFPDCDIECLYYNFPILTSPGSEKWSESDKETMREFDRLIEKHRELPVVKLHTGQRFFIRNLEFEVLATHEDIYPRDLECFNNSSTILLMTVDNCKTLFLGDADVAECTVVVARYGAHIKSEIVQVAHHGYNATNVGIYHCAEASVALYPNRQSRYDEIKTTASNQEIIKSSKEIYVAGNGMVALKLPYILGTATVFPKEIMD